jgi:hypothetical protein
MQSSANEIPGGTQFIREEVGAVPHPGKSGLMSLVHVPYGRMRF